ncbi:keratinocyte proline-rich protein-like [Cydia amplana]|uniref:keratinocyte proline-rich protein-like n=1 Tax=Cydia amplana TaxID=1869771 RepID=UPI002FE5FCF0
MSDCCKTRTKNPCMVCKRTVTAKTGLQCQGSCKSWIHFTCCSYTPGKIKDIKAKTIKVRCPCPDCSNPQGPKEVIMKDSGFTCVNKTCPINLPPSCKNDSLDKMNQQPSPCTFSCKEWPGVPCSAESCRDNTQEDCCPDESYPIPHQHPPCPPSPPPAPCIPAPKPCPPPPPCPPPKPCTTARPCPPAKTCPPAKPSPKPCSPAPMTPTSNSPSPPRRMSPSSTPVMPSISLVENMCETVGLLSDQLNQLMCKMTDVLNPSANSQRESSSCRCPKNPRR